MVRFAPPSRRREIMDAARGVFQARGYSQARIAEIAERAGIAAGTLYLYFESKEALAQALCEDYVTRLMESIQPHLAHPNTATAIAESVRTALAFASAERDLLPLLGSRVGLGAQSQPLASELILHQTLAETLAARMEQGHIRRYDPRVLAELIAGLIEWVSRASALGGNPNAARYQQSLIQMLQHALLTDSSTSVAKAAKPKKRKKRS